MWVRVLSGRERARACTGAGLGAWAPPAGAPGVQVGTGCVPSTWVDLGLLGCVGRAGFDQRRRVRTPVYWRVTRFDLRILRPASAV